MKILFLQKVDNACGGITNVNINLISHFLSLNYEVDVLSLRHGDTWEEVHYPEGAEVYLLNDKDVWGCPRLIELIALLKKGHLIKGGQLLINRWIYKRKMAADYIKCQKMIEKLAPDVIINSHYEVLDGISDEYLKKTIMHFHTSFDQVLANSSYLKCFKKYASKVYNFVWLSEKTKNEAVSYGFKNSRCIYNPLAFSTTRSADISNKKMVFIGRLAEEKRVHLAIENFREVVQEYNLNDWVFEIYGFGELTDQVKELVKNDSQIFYKGRTSQAKEVLLSSSLVVLTSRFEGMPLVVLEANECGVPAITYNFGESCCEVILDQKTGIIVPQNNKEVFKQELRKVLEDDEYRKKLSIQAKEFAKRFHIESVGEKWIELFKEMGNSLE